MPSSSSSLREALPDFPWITGKSSTTVKGPRTREKGLAVTLNPVDREWQAEGLCRGNHSHLFFPPSTIERKDERERREMKAKAICSVCQVQGECLDYAVTIREPYGIWGGLTEIERRQLLARNN